MTILAFCAVPGWASPAHGQENEIFPGMVHQRIEGFGQVAHVLEVDLARPEYSLRVNREEQGRRTPGQFGQDVGAAAVINGDWDTLGGASPFGLSVGDGWQWAGRDDPPSEGAPHHWSFFACTAEKQCHVDPPQTQTRWRSRWIQVVGGNDAVLVIDGVAQPNDNPDGTYADRHPRSAICVDEAGTLLRLIVVQGRRGDSAGMSWGETADFVASLGCHQAMMLEGGGSSSLVADGRLLNDRPDNEPAQRAVINQWAIMRSFDVDPPCVDRQNGRHCDGDVLVTCQGGGADPSDCSVFGMSCQEARGTAFCVDPICRNGPGGSVCRDDSIIVGCEYGQAFDDSCGAFGLTCGEGDGMAFCVDPRCVQGGHTAWCDGDTLKTCTRGAYTEADCDANGQVCEGGRCVDPVDPGDPRCEGRADTSFCEGDQVVSCVGAVYGLRDDCGAAGRLCVDGTCRDLQCVDQLNSIFCEGDTLVECSRGLVSTRDCTTEGQTCQGWRCAEPLVGPGEGEGEAPPPVTGEGEGEGEGEPQCPEGTRWADGECHPSQGEGEGEGEGPPAGEGGGPSQPPGEGEGQAAPCPAGQERVNGACTPAVDEPGAPQDDPSGQDIAPSGAPSGEGCACRGVEAPSTANAPWGALLRR